MTADEGIQTYIAAILTLTLLAVGWYAWEARKQATASLEMAREMRETRYADLLPVLDFAFVEEVPNFNHIFAIKGGNFPDSMEGIHQEHQPWPGLGYQLSYQNYT